MRMKLFSVRDQKAGVSFPRIAVAESAVEALRNFETLCKEKGELSSHPDDFVLFELGEYDRESGFVHGYDNPIPLASPRDFLRVPPASVGVANQVS